MLKVSRIWFCWFLNKHLFLQFLIFFFLIYGQSLPKILNKMSFNVDRKQKNLIWFCWQRRKPLAYQEYPCLPSCHSIQEVHYLQVCLFLQEFQEDRFLGFLWDQWVPGVQGFQGVRLFRQHLCLPKIRFKKKTLLIRPFMLSILH